MDKFTGILLKPNRKPEVVYFDSMDVTLEQLYKLVECDTIQIVRVPNTHYLMVIDDNGKFLRKHLNILATILYQNTYDCIVGNALVLIDEDAYSWDKYIEPDAYAIPPYLYEYMTATLEQLNKYV